MAACTVSPTTMDNRSQRQSWAGEMCFQDSFTPPFHTIAHQAWLPTVGGALRLAGGCRRSVY